MELYKRYRPSALREVVGQAAALAPLQKMIDRGEVPHALLLSGPSGCGKTTVARILKRELGCGDPDFVELNCADFRGVDMVRDIRRSSSLRPISGRCRIWLVDEAHKLTNDAQNALLKLLEDTPPHVYFFLCTTDPQKLIPTIHTRCTEIRLSSLSPAALCRVVGKVLEAEGVTLAEEVVDEVVDAAGGSARKALVVLEQVLQAGDDVATQLRAVQTATVNKDLAISLARALFAPNPHWSDVAAILKELKDDPDGVRMLILSYARTVLLGGGKLAPRAFQIIDIFSEPFFNSHHAGLAAACWAAVNSRS